MKQAWKKLSALVLALILLLALLPCGAMAADTEIVASGECGAEGDNLTWTLDSEGTLTISGTGAMDWYYYEDDLSDSPFSWVGSRIKIVIINEGVTSIGQGAFPWCNLTSVTIPESVTSIGYGAFYRCSGLTSVAIPASVTSIDDYAFSGCSGLTSVTIPESVTSIGGNVFYGCENLVSIAVESGNASYCADDGIVFSKDKTQLSIFPCGRSGSYVIPSSVTTIDGYAFSGCSGLTSVTIPESVTSIDDYAFSGCSGLTSVTIPESVTSVGYRAFNGCSGLMSVTIPDSVTTWGNYAFQDCSGLTSVVIPEGATNIGYGAFLGCSGLTSVTIPEGVTYIWPGAFCGCSGLTSITIPDGVTTISEFAFRDCSGLTSVTIPEGVTYIGPGAFQGCSSLTNVTIPSSVTTFVSETWTFDDPIFDGCSELTSAGPIGSGCSIEFGWKESIPAYAFSRLNQALTDILLPNGLTTIGEKAFLYCSGLTTVTIPNSVTSIGDGAFSCCSGLTSVTIPDSVTTIGGGAFDNCFSLTSVMIPEGVTSIGPGAFHWSGLTSVTIPASMTTIDYGVFYECALTSVTISDGVTTIGREAFWNCKNLTSMTIPASVTSISSNAFYGCSVLADVYYGGTVDDWARISIATGNESLTNATIHFSEVDVEIIASGECGAEGDNLTWTLDNEGTLTISGTGEMQNWAIFESSWYGYIEQIKKVVIENGVTSIGNFAFGDCYRLTSVTIPVSVTNIGDSAFVACFDLTNVTIPDSVTSIGNRAFSDCSSLMSVTIPDSVTSIGNYAFFYCNGLTSVTIPTSVTSIGYEAFFDCSGLTSVTIQEGVTSIGDSAFSNCSNLTSVTIPDSVTSIGNYAFSNCSSLTSVTIPEGVIGIGSGVFYGCSGLSSVTIPTSVTSIGYDAFYGCSSLSSVTIPTSVTSIGEDAFYGCSSLSSVTIPDSVTSIGNYAFSGCSSLTEIVVSPDNSAYSSEGGILFNKDKAELILCPEGKPGDCMIPDSVTSIGDSAFSNCSNLTSVTIPDSVTTIGNGAFSGCSSLSSVTIPVSVTSIGVYAFVSCDALADVYYGGTEDDWARITINPGNESLANATIHFREVDVEIIASGECGAEGDNLTWTLDSEGTLTIRGTGEMQNWAIFESSWYGSIEQIKKVVIENGVTSIGNFAFGDCYRLTSLAIPPSIATIGERAFEHCSSLTSVTIPEGVTTIGGDAFAYCSGLTSVTIPTSVTTIGGGAFAYCSSLTNVTIPEGVMAIGGNTFEYCSGLTSVTIPTSVTTIGNYAFKGCSGLTSVTIPEGVTGIGEDAFYGCSGLSSVTIPDSVTTIGGGAFSGCSSLTEIAVSPDNPAYSSEDGILFNKDKTWLIRCPAKKQGDCVIHNGATIIYEEAFQGCDGLTGVTIPESLTMIGNRAFEGCSGLDSIVIPEGVQSIGISAFQDCGGLTSVTIPASVKGIGDDLLDECAFGGCSSLTEIVVSAYNTRYSSENGILYNKNKTKLIQCPGGKQGELSIPEGVTSIGNHAFQGCGTLTSVTIPESVTSIGYDAFPGCSSLEEIEVNPDNAQYFSENGILCNSVLRRLLRYPCGKQGEVLIPEGMLSIGGFAFSGCIGLTHLTIPESVRSIGDYAFSGCSSLTSVTIPGGVTMDFNAFLGCNSLSDVYYTGDRNSWEMLPPSKELNSAEIHFPIYIHYYPNGGVGVVSRQDGFDHTLLTLMDCDFTREGYTFSGWNTANDGTGDKYTASQAVALNGNLTLFAQWTAKEAGLADRGNCGAEGDNLTWMLDSEGTLTISGTGAMQTWAYFESSWYSNRQIKNVVIETGVTSIGNRAFEECSGLTSVTIPPSVRTIGDYAFIGCSSLTSVTIPEGVTTIGYGAFVVCSGLTSVTIPASVTSISSTAFSGCSSLTSVTIPESVTSIGDYAFNGCSSLTSVTIPESVTSIGSLAFYGCSVLADVYYGGTEDDWARITINGGNESLTNATIHFAKALLPGAIGSITATAGTGKTTVSWTEAENSPQYIVQRRIKGEDSWKTLKSNVTGTSYDDTTGVAGTVYQYRVRGRNGTDYGPFKLSSVVRAQAGSSAGSPGAIASVSAKAEAGKTTVFWSASEGATAYIIQRRVKDGDTWTTLKSNVTALNYEDTTGVAGTVYQYRVRGRDGTNYGPFKVSSVIRAVTGSGGGSSNAPGAIASITTRVLPGRITVFWTASEGATAYIIQRRVKDGDTWTTLKSNVTGLSYEDTTGVPGTVYQYRVRGRNGTNYGPFKLCSVVRAVAAE